MKELFLLTICLCLLLQSQLSFCFRLNVPKVLLPYHVNTAVNFTLEVTDPEGGCFHWRSTRPEIATVAAEVASADPTVTCSDRAVVSAVSKHKQAHTAIVFAQDTITGVRLRCDVMVDVLDSIEIVTTTRKLFLEDAPEEFIVRAQNAQKDTFSELAGLSFDWEVQPKEKNAHKSKQTLKIIPFSESKYETPPAIELLETAGLQGHVILMEGISTGSARLTVSLTDEQYKDIKPHSIDLVVIANLILNPAYDIYVAVHSVVHYQVELIKQGRVEEVSMPSDQYFLELSDTAVASLEKQTSNVSALKFGQTQISLSDRNVDSDLLLQRPSAYIYVSTPATLTLTVRPGGVWVLETDRIYEIELKLFDTDHNEMYISENMRFSVDFEQKYFEILQRSTNGSYLIVRTKTKGQTELKATLDSIVAQTGSAHKFDTAVRGRQNAEIYDKMVLKPQLLAFAWDPIGKARYHHQIQVSGGSGHFVWSSSDKQVCVVAEQNGQLSTVTVGEAAVTARDARNKLHSAQAIVVVTPPTRLSFAESKLEAEVGSELRLELRMFGRRLDGTRQEVEFMDCSQLQIDVKLEDAIAFNYEKSSRSSSVGCVSLLLTALKSGDTKVSVEYRGEKVQLKSQITISAFDPLLITRPSGDLMLALGSSYAVEFESGPRPWVLDGSKYFASMTDSLEKEAVLSVEKSVRSNPRITFTVTCTVVQGSTELALRVGNGKTASNPLPVVAQVVLKVCCSIPQDLQLLPHLPNAGPNLPPCPLSQHSTQEAFAFYFGKDIQMELVARGICAPSPEQRIFDNFDSLDLEWKSSKREFLAPTDGLKKSENDKFFKSLVPQGKAGSVTVSVSSSAFAPSGCRNKKCQKQLPSVLSEAVDVSLVDFARLIPDSVAIFNHAKNKALLKVEGGSGHFYISPSSPANAYGRVELERNTITFTPKRNGHSALQVYDLCLGAEHAAKADLFVSDVERIELSGPDLVQVGHQIKLTVRVFDQRNQPFSADVFKLLNLQPVLDASGILSVSPKPSEEPDSFELVLVVFGVKVATDRVSIVGHSAAGREVTSNVLTVQVFAPLTLRPKRVTLIQDSVFQLEALGGPQPSPGLHFSLNNSAIARVSDLGLIDAQKLGFAKITAAQQTRGNAQIVSQDSVYLRVVSLTGIKIRVPVAQIHVGTTLPAFAMGLSEDETPFSFGGAKYPLKFEWILDSQDVAGLEQVFDKANLLEAVRNQFATRLVARRPGHVTLRLRATVHPSGNSQFVPPQTEFKDSVKITVVEPLMLKRPDVGTGAHLLITPNTDMKLLTNRPASDVHYSIVSWHSSSKYLVSLDPSTARLRSAASTGSSALVVNAVCSDATGTRNESLAVMVEVLPVSYIMLNLESRLKTSKPLDRLPVGFSLEMAVSFHDKLGRKFDAANTQLGYRPHRFDLADVFATNSNRSLNLHLKHWGDTVLKVWDVNEPKIVDFVRLTVGDVIEPNIRQLVVGDIVCLQSPFDAEMRWHVDKTSVVDWVSGALVAKQPGRATATLEANGRKTRTELTVTTPERIRLDQSELYVSNANWDKEFVFGVVLCSAHNQSSNIHGCAGSMLLSSLPVPISCSLDWDKQQPLAATNVFTVKAAFSSQLNSYVCVVKALPLESVEQHSRLATFLVVSTRLGDQYDSLSVPFYPQIYVQQKELHLNNAQNQRTQITVNVSPLLASQIKLEASNSNLLQISGPERDIDQPGRLQYAVTLVVKSAQLWQETGVGDVKLKISSALNSQTISLPVHIKLYGDAPKAAFMAANATGFWGFLEVFLEYYGSALLVFLSIVATLVCLYIGYRVFASRPLIVDQTGVFASEPSQSYVQWRTYNNPSMAQSFQSSPDKSTYLWTLDRGQTPPGSSPVQFGQRASLNRSR